MRWGSGGPDGKGWWGRRGIAGKQMGQGWWGQKGQMAGERGDGRGRRARYKLLGVVARRMVGGSSSR